MATINISRVDGTAYETVTGIRADTSTRGVDLAGALITATFADGTTEDLIWEAFDPFTFGGWPLPPEPGEDPVETDINLLFGFDVHELTTTKLLATLEFDLVPASSVFDTTTAMDNDPNGGSTPGSANGFSFDFTPEYQSLTGNVDVTYSNIVKLVGSPAKGDLYTTMLIDFTGLAGGGVLGQVDWNTDMDTLEVAGDLVPVVPPFTGGPGNDVLTGDADANVITGNGGADTLRGVGGDDTIDGGDGDDRLIGGNDEDSLIGGGDNDVIFGNGGLDIILGGNGLDTVFAGAGDDDVTAGSDQDSVLGQGGDDTIRGGSGYDTLRGGSGDDSIVGGADDDIMFGNGNDDTLRGGEGDDSMQGASGADRLFGDGGDDTLFSGNGADRLDGGSGDDLLNGGVADGARDVFVFLVGYDEDRINQFDQTGTDELELDETLWSATDPGLTAQEVVDMFGTLNSNSTILTLDFGGSDVLEVQNSGGIDIATFGADIVLV